MFKASGKMGWLKYFSYWWACLMILAMSSFLIWDNKEFIAESSVWCINDARFNKMCHFKNLCYNSSSSSFELYLTSNSIISGVSSVRELQKIQLSSIKDHTQFFINISTYSDKIITDVDIVFTKTLALARFKPDNLMHIIHDDLIPIFGTFNALCEGNIRSCVKDFNLFFLDKNDEGPYFFLYQLFSRNHIFLKDVSTQFVCFKDLHVGLNIESIWYEYGFKKPRGYFQMEHFDWPLLVRFRNFIRNEIGVKPSANYALFFQRQHFRKILNVGYAIELFKKEYSGKVITVNVTYENTKEIMAMVFNADVILGIHGAELILGLFMKEHGKIIELFPYGLSSTSVSYLKPLTKLSPCLLSYFFWENNVASNSRQHPEYPRQYGGLTHLPSNVQLHIKLLKKIESVYCCDSPEFLFFMYQDTIVNAGFQKVVLLALNTPPAVSCNVISYWSYPAHVVSPLCILDRNCISIEWLPPDNFHSTMVYYMVSVQLEKYVKEYFTDVTHLSIPVQTNIASVWIAAKLRSNNETGPDTYLKCRIPD